jgi:DNA-binding NarL/FixJ family response regulator
MPSAPSSANASPAAPCPSSIQSIFTRTQFALSPREREVLQLIARGHSNRQIARDLAIGEQTVKTHVRSILTKLGLQDRVQTAILALRHQTDSREHRP